MILILSLCHFNNTLLERSKVPLFYTNYPCQHSGELWLTGTFWKSGFRYFVIGPGYLKGRYLNRKLPDENNGAKNIFVRSKKIYFMTKKRFFATKNYFFPKIKSIFEFYGSFSIRKGWIYIFLITHELAVASSVRPSVPTIWRPTESTTMLFKQLLKRIFCVFWWIQVSDALQIHL